MRLPLTSNLVACVNRPWSFTDDDGNPRSGVTREVWVSTSSTEAPTKLGILRTPDDPSIVLDAGTTANVMESQTAHAALLADIDAGKLKQFDSFTCEAEVNAKGRWTLLGYRAAK